MPTFYPHLMNIDTLCAQVEAGEVFEYLLFWGHRPRKDGRFGPTCLSQWFVSPFTVDGRRYPTAEHWMMAGKARLFEDAAALEQIFTTDSPNAAKKIGRRVKGFDGAAWDAAKFDLVVEGNRHKFGQNPAMAAFLKGTGDKIIVEASPYDRIWGVGLGRDDPRIKDPRTWQGPNLLGFALMVVRAELQAGSAGG